MAEPLARACRRRHGPATRRLGHYIRSAHGYFGSHDPGGRRSHGRIAHRACRLATETEATFKPAEFWALLGPIGAILVTATVISGGDNGTDGFIARQTWLCVAILGGAYFISRGLAKSGTQTHMTGRTASATTGGAS